MADETYVKTLTINTANGSYQINTSDIYTELGISEDRFIELLSRDAYCPTLSAAPTSSTLTYIDTDGSENHFQVGQPCRWAEDGDYRIAVCKNITETSSEWYIFPIKTSELIHDSGWATTEALENGLGEKQDTITDLETIRSGAALGATALQSVPSEYITETELTGKGYATTTSMNTALAGKQDTISDLATIRSGAALGATALQSYTEQYTGTITGIKMNGASKGTSGVVDLGTVITEHQDISGKLDATTAASTYATKTENSAKQDKNLYFTDVTASSWVTSTTYADYGYQCDVACSGATAEMYAEVVFAPSQATNGNYAPICETSADIVRIYSKVNTSITIPTITISK